MKIKYLLSSLFSFFLFFSFVLPHLAFADTVTLSGSVKDANGNAIVGATVEVNDANNDSTTTDISGVYTLVIPSGTYNVQVTPPAGSGFTSAVAFSQSISADKVINFILTPAGTVALSGHIYGPLGNPLPNISVNLGSTSVTTGSDGSYSLQVPSGTNALLDINNFTGTGNIQSLNTAQYIRFYVNNFTINESTVLDITIPSKEVTVHVKDLQGNPVGNVGIDISESATEGNLSIGGGITNANGSTGYTTPYYKTDVSGVLDTYLLPTTSDHKYTFKAVPPSGSGFQTTTVSNVTFTNDTDVTITLQQPVTLSGHVYGPLGNPLPNMSVILGSTTTTTGSDGSYSLTVSPGTYAQLEINNFSGNGNPPSLNAAQYIRLVVPNYNITNNTVLDISVPSSTVTVHVKDALGNPVSNTEIDTVQSDPESGLSIGGGITNATGTTGYGSPSFKTDASGVLILYLLPTTSNHKYTFTAVPPSGSGFQSTNVSNITFTGDTDINITLQKPVTLSGHVYGPLGNPLPNMSVILGSTTVVTDVNGSYSMQASSGTYSVLDINNFSGDGNPPSLNSPQYIRLYVNNYTIAQDTVLDITVPAKKVTVHVQDAQGNPVNNVEIDANESATESNLSIGGTITNANGSTGYGSTGYGSPNFKTDSSGNLDMYLLPTTSNHTYTFTAVPPGESIYSTFTLNEISIVGNETELISLQYNHATPTTTSDLTAQNPDETYSDPTNVTLTASAAASYTVANTYYKVDGGSQQTYTNPFTITGNGEHAIEYWSVDNSGVQESHHTQTFTINSTYSLSGTVYVDANDNGVQDSGELGYNGATLTLNSGQTATTDANGDYNFQNLQAGTYMETLTVPNGYVATTTNPVSVPLVSDTTENFGIINAKTSLKPVADSYIKSGSQNENEGGSSFLRIQSSGNNRALVKFDQSQIQQAVGSSQDYIATLRFTISDNGNNWGKNGRMIGLHRLTQNWAEGNGFIDGNRPKYRGTGVGLTWSCATDTNIANQRKDCSGSTSWDMSNSSLWPFVSVPTATANIKNNQIGIVKFDVTSEIQYFINNTNKNYGWLMKKTNEGQNGSIEFGSKESGIAPQLIITRN